MLAGLKQRRPASRRPRLPSVEGRPSPGPPPPALRPRPGGPGLPSALPAGRRSARHGSWSSARRDEGVHPPCPHEIGRRRARTWIVRQSTCPRRARVAARPRAARWSFFTVASETPSIFATSRFSNPGKYLSSTTRGRPPRRNGFETLEGGVESQEILRAGARPGRRGWRWGLPLGGGLLARVIDQVAAHHACGHGEEVLDVLEPRPPLLPQRPIELVDQAVGCRVWLALSPSKRRAARRCKRSPSRSTSSSSARLVALGPSAGTGPPRCCDVFSSSTRTGPLPSAWNRPEPDSKSVSLCHRPDSESYVSSSLQPPSARVYVQGLTKEDSLNRLSTNRRRSGNGDHNENRKSPRRHPGDRRVRNRGPNASGRHRDRNDSGGRTARHLATRRARQPRPAGPPSRALYAAGGHEPRPPTLERTDAPRRI